MLGEDRNCDLCDQMGRNNNCECNSCNCHHNIVGCDSNSEMNYDCNYETPQGINAAFGYNTVSMTRENMNSCNQEMDCAEKRRIREEMIHKIKALNFAIIELGLYLNTHHNDQRALCLHREYTKQLKELKDQYQRVYGPLSIYYPCNKWRWLEEPWPWEGGNC